MLYKKTCPIIFKNALINKIFYCQLQLVLAETINTINMSELMKAILGLFHERSIFILLPSFIHDHVKNIKGNVLHVFHRFLKRLNLQYCKMKLFEVASERKIDRKIIQQSTPNTLLNIEPIHTLDIHTKRIFDVILHSFQYN